MRLLHIHLPYRAPSLYPPYTIASRIQERLRRRQLDFKDATTIPLSVKSNSGNNNHQPPTGVTAPPPPPPTLLSFTPLPTYTLGRRQTAPLSDTEVARLRAPLHTSSSTTTDSNNSNNVLPVTILPSPRGGLTTYHGPGQVVLWPVLDLRSPHHKQFTVRCYSRLLENTTIATLASVSSPPLHAFTTDDPGVWVHSPSPTSTATEPAKIAALGVHLRRHVSALGTAINVDMPGPEERSEEVNPWARIVACGLEGKTVTSLVREARLARRGGGNVEVTSGGGGGGGGGGTERGPGLKTGEDIGEEAVAAAWAEELARRIGVDGVETMRAEDVLELLLVGTHESGEGEDDGTRALEEAYMDGIRRELGR